MSGLTVAVMCRSSCALDRAGEVACWGDNSLGQLGNGLFPMGGIRQCVTGLAGPAVEITSGGDHFCVRLADGSAECWGWNAWGQIGDYADSILDEATRVRF